MSQHLSIRRITSYKKTPREEEVVRGRRKSDFLLLLRAPIVTTAPMREEEVGLPPPQARATHICHAYRYKPITALDSIERI